MTPDQIRDAILYNVTQGFTVEQVKLIQRVVGTTCDGIWGPETVRTIFAWQSQNGVAAPEGKVWNDAKGNTWPKIQEAAKRFEEQETDKLRRPGDDMLTIGCWVDDEVRIQKPEYFERMAEAGLSSISLMLDTSKKAWDPVYNHEAIERIVKLAEAHCFEVVLTTWPFPDKTVIDPMCAAVRKWLSIAPEVTRAFEVDAEFNWKPRFVRGFDSLDAAGDYLVKSMDEAVADTKARKELTTFTSHTENGRAADVAPYMDRLLGQAYSVRHRRKTDGSDWLIPWGHSYGPGAMQRWTLDRTLTVPGVLETIELGCGLAAYDQEWAGHRAEDALRLAYDTALVYGCREIRYWSFKWIFGHLSNKYAERFLRKVAADRR